MTFQTKFVDFWESVKESIANYTFAKLTLAKTIGDTELKNIYMRPILVDDQVHISLIARYKTEQVENFYTLDEAFFVLSSYLNNPFLMGLLFTTDNDLIFKLNKKRVATIVKKAPTFKNASEVVIIMQERKIILE